MCVLRSERHSQLRFAICMWLMIRCFHITVGHHLATVCGFRDRDCGLNGPWLKFHTTFEPFCQLSPILAEIMSEILKRNFKDQPAQNSLKKKTIFLKICKLFVQDLISNCKLYTFYVFFLQVFAGHCQPFPFLFQNIPLGEACYIEFSIDVVVWVCRKCHSLWSAFEALSLTSNVSVFATFEVPSQVRNVTVGTVSSWLFAMCQPSLKPYCTMFDNCDVWPWAHNAPAAQCRPWANNS